jgi:hypothetical protein
MFLLAMADVSMISQFILFNFIAYCGIFRGGFWEIIGFRLELRTDVDVEEKAVEDNRSEVEDKAVVFLTAIVSDKLSSLSCLWSPHSFLI